MTRLVTYDDSWHCNGRQVYIYDWDMRKWVWQESIGERERELIALLDAAAGDSRTLTEIEGVGERTEHTYWLKF